MLASIIHNTNEAVSNSGADWSFFRVGTFVKFGSEDVYYTISKTQKQVFVFHATPSNSKEVVLSEDFLGILAPNETVSIRFKEYSLWALYGTISGGVNYKIGDELIFEGGEVIVDTFSGKKQEAKVKVIKVTETGGVEEVELVEDGRYYSPPNSEVKTKGGKGYGCILKVQYKQTDSEKILERDIQSINLDEKKIEFTDPLPNLNNELVITTNKWKMFLTSSYLGETQINTPISFVKDVTPYLNVPLLLPHSASVSSTYNLAMQLLDKKIHELESKINALTVK